MENKTKIKIVKVMNRTILTEFKLESEMFWKAIVSIISNNCNFLFLTRWITESLKYLFRQFLSTAMRDWHNPRQIDKQFFVVLLSLKIIFNAFKRIMSEEKLTSLLDRKKMKRYKKTIAKNCRIRYVNWKNFSFNLKTF